MGRREVPPFIVTGDLHLTDREQDDYRFGLFPWLRDQAEQHKAKAIVILGDLTDAKDRHPARLVNRMVRCLNGLSEAAPIYILRGNHDYVDPHMPFFGFLNELENIEYINTTTAFEWFGSEALFLPHTKEPDKDWKGLRASNYDFIFLHHTFNGAQTSNGTKLPGTPTARWDSDRPSWVFSGDIHVPQKIGPVTYVGSPYHIHFGDSFQPRVLLVGEKIKSLRFETTSKHTLEVQTIDDLKRQVKKLRPGDQVKVRFNLTRADMLDWSKYMAATTSICRDGQVRLFGADVRIVGEAGRVKSDKVNKDTTSSLDAKDILKQFIEREKIDREIADRGMVLLKQHLSVAKGV